MWIIALWAVTGIGGLLCILLTTNPRPIALEGRGLLWAIVTDCVLLLVALVMWAIEGIGIVPVTIFLLIVQVLTCNMRRREKDAAS